jgi:cytochrome c oxidase subunit 2
MPLLGNANRLEQWLIGIVLVVLVFSFGMVVFSVTSFGVNVANCVTTMTPFTKGEVIQHDETHFEIHYVARMWSFDPPEVVVPPKAQVDIYLTSADVTHGFYLPGTNVNMMAVPGAVNYLRTKFDKEGVYGLLCHEYCGTGHQDMGAVLRVEPFGLTKERLEREAAVPPGRKLVQTKGCVGCHSNDGTPSTGPTFKGLYGKQEQLMDGTQVSVDDAYIKESVAKPTVKVVKGFAPIMPAFVLSDDEQRDLIDYLKSLQ